MPSIDFRWNKKVITEDRPFSFLSLRRDPWKNCRKKKKYQRPELLEYENLNEITAGNIPLSGPA